MKNEVQTDRNVLKLPDLTSDVTVEYLKTNLRLSGNKAMVAKYEHLWRTSGWFAWEGPD